MGRPSSPPTPGRRRRRPASRQAQPPLTIGHARTRHERPEARGPDRGVQVPQHQGRLPRAQQTRQLIHVAVPLSGQEFPQGRRRVDAQDAQRPPPGFQAQVQARVLRTYGFDGRRPGEGTPAQEGNAEGALLQALPLMGVAGAQALQQGYKIRRRLQEQDQVRPRRRGCQPGFQAPQGLGGIELQQRHHFIPGRGRLLGPEEGGQLQAAQGQQGQGCQGPAPGAGPEENGRQDQGRQPVLDEEMGEQFGEPVPAAPITQADSGSQQPEQDAGTAQEGGFQAFRPGGRHGFPQEKTERRGAPFQVLLTTGPIRRRWGRSCAPAFP